MNDTNKWIAPNPLTTDWWEQACECYAAGKPNPPITEQPQTSWLRAAVIKNGPLLPVSYWYDNGKLYCRIANSIFEDSQPIYGGTQTIRQFWPFASKRPVTYEQWEYYEKDGKWPDMPDTVYVNKELRGLARMKANIEPLLTQATEMIKGGAAKTQEDAIKANNLHNQLTAWHKTNKDRLRELRNEDPEITLEVIRGFEIYQRVTAQINDLVKRCEIYKTLKATCIDPYLKANKPNVPAGEPRISKTLPGVVGRTVSLTRVKKVKLINLDTAIAHIRSLEEESVDLGVFVAELGQRLHRKTKTVPPGFEEYTEEESR